MAVDHRGRRLVRFYPTDKLPTGKPFSFQSNPARLYVRDPKTGAVMSLKKWKEREARMR